MEKPSDKAPKNNGETIGGNGEETPSGKKDDFNFVIEHMQKRCKRCKRCKISWKL